MADLESSHREIVHKLTLQEESGFNLCLDFTSAERLQMVWPLTQDCWSFVPGYKAEQEFQRHVVSVSRRES
jgi:agmatine/peptidylarginine deiminase